jgi:DNA (cytosine-5)-methyltransferase 1
MIKVGSDFSGVGAFNQALLRLKIEHEEVFACDMNKWARQTFVLNYGEPSYYPENVYDREIPKDPLTIYMSSPPCQSFSKNGNRKGKNDERGILFFNSHEFILKNKPRYFIFENVKGLLSDDDGKTFQEWVNMLGGKSVNGLPVLFPYNNSVPYHIYYKVLNSKDHNVPQNRERIFIVGIRDDSDNIFRFPKKVHMTKSLNDVLEPNPDPKYNLTDTKIEYILRTEKTDWGRNFLGKGIPKYSNCIDATYHKGHRTAQIISYSRDNVTGKVVKRNLKNISNTLHLSTGAGGNTDQFVLYNTIRRLTPRECFRLMDFPDTFKWDCSDTQAYSQAGNSIVVKCLELIIQRLNLNEKV